MNYLASLSDFFKSPKWANNLLLGGVCMLIPIVGPLVLMGWHVSGFWGRKNTEDFTTYPTFDFSNFGKYLERGVWPFLVMVVLSLVMVPVVFAMIFMTIPMQIAAIHDHGQGHEAIQAVSALTIIASGLVWLVVIVIMMLLTRPLTIAASITQDFASAFNLRRLKSFVLLMWPEMLVSMLFVWLVSIVLMLAGMAAACVGIYFTIPLIYFVNTHLDWQLNLLYVARGGEPISLSPKLNDSPPPLPLAAN